MVTVLSAHPKLRSIRISLIWKHSSYRVLKGTLSRYLAWQCPPLNTVSIEINESPVEHANTFKYLGVSDTK